MSLVHWYRAAGARVMSVFRLDWQVHFFWGLFLTLTGQFWPPLYLAGFLVTVGKQFLICGASDTGAGSISPAGAPVALRPLRSSDRLVGTVPKMRA